MAQPRRRRTRPGAGSPPSRSAVADDPRPRASLEEVASGAGRGGDAARTVARIAAVGLLLVGAAILVWPQATEQILAGVGFGGRRASPVDAYVAALILDASSVRPGAWRTLVDLNCADGAGAVGVRVLAKRGVEAARAKVGAMRTPSCAPFVIEGEDEVLVSEIAAGAPPQGRVGRIAALRDRLRASLRPEFLSADPASSAGANGSAIRNGVVMVVDLDVTIPSAPVLAAQIDEMLHRKHRHDVVCATGIGLALEKRPFYYDIFATILLPDTFAYPVVMRLNESFYPGEDPSLVPAQGYEGNFTQFSMLTYFQKEGERSLSGAVSVRSCFGGLTLYRAEVWFDDRCNYSDDHSALVRYANKGDMRPCEHVVFHDCLKRLNDEEENGRDVDLAVHPGLVTQWHAV